MGYTPHRSSGIRAPSGTGPTTGAESSGDHAEASQQSIASKNWDRLRKQAV
ncbi:MAG: hypothetical protein ACKVOP_02515 [Sphingomonadaceae bacterium]